MQYKDLQPIAERYAELLKECSDKLQTDLETLSWDEQQTMIIAPEQVYFYWLRDIENLQKEIQNFMQIDD